MWFAFEYCDKSVSTHIDRSYGYGLQVISIQNSNSGAKAQAALKLNYDITQRLHCTRASSFSTLIISNLPQLLKYAHQSFWCCAFSGNTIYFSLSAIFYNCQAVRGQLRGFKVSTGPQKMELQGLGLKFCHTFIGTSTRTMRFGGQLRKVIFSIIPVAAVLWTTFGCIA